MIPLILLLVSIESLPDGETRIRFTLDRPVALTGGGLTVELDEAVFGDITGFEVFGGAGDESAVAIIEGRKVRLSFNSLAAGIGRIADRPVLMLRARAAGAPKLDAVKVAVPERGWPGTGVQMYPLRVTEGPVPAQLPEERFDSIPAGAFRIQLPKQRLTAGEGGPFRSLAPGGIAIRNPHAFSVDVLYQETGILREVRAERRLSLAPGEHFYSQAFDYARFYASAEMEMGQLRWQAQPSGPVITMSASPMVPVAARPSEFRANPLTLDWHWQMGTPPPAPKGISISSDRAPVVRPEYLTHSAARWLTVTRGTPGLLVAVDPSGLTPGVYRDFITITPVATEFFPAGAAAVVGVTLTVSAEAQQKLSFRSRSFPLFHLERFVVGGAGVTTVYPDIPRNWLTAIPGPFNLAVASNGDLLGPGYYGGHVVVRGANFTDVIQVTTIAPGSPLIETASAARFVMASGGRPPEPQRLPVQSPGRFSALVQTDSGGNWLSTVAEAGAITLSVNPAGLRAGVYTALVTLTAPGAAGTRQIPVALLIHPNPPEALLPNPAAIELRVTTGSPSQPFVIPMTSGLRVEGLQWNVEMDSGSGWLLRDQGVDEYWTVGVRIDPSRLSPGLYTGRVTVRTSMQSVVIPVRLEVVEPPAGGERPHLGTILNAASSRESVLAPGEQIVILGGYFTGVSLNGIAIRGPVAAVPRELAGLAEVTLRLIYGEAHREYVLPLAEAAPGVFTLDGAGKGQALARNGNGTMNDEEHRALRGSVVWLQATGVKRDDVVVEIGGVAARALHVFPLDETIPGRDWIEFVLPADAPAGKVPLVVVSAGTRSQDDVYLWVDTSG